MRGQSILSFALAAFTTTVLAAPLEGRSVDNVVEKAPFGIVDNHFVSERTPIVDVSNGFTGSRKRATTDDEDDEEENSSTAAAEKVEAPKANANGTLSTPPAKSGTRGVAGTASTGKTTAKAGGKTTAAKKATSGVGASGKAAPTGKTTASKKGKVKTSPAGTAGAGVTAPAGAVPSGKATAKGKKSTSGAAGAGVTAPAGAVPTGKATAKGKKSTSAIPAKLSPTAATATSLSTTAEDPLAELTALLSGDGAANAASPNSPAPAVADPLSELTGGVVKRSLFGTNDAEECDPEGE